MDNFTEANLCVHIMGVLFEVCTDIIFTVATLGSGVNYFYIAFAR